MDSKMQGTEIVWGNWEERVSGEVKTANGICHL
jgi:hypothetical protein